MRSASTAKAPRGFSLIEILVVVVMVGIMLANVVPRFRVSATTRTRQAADQLVRDLETARSRALASKSTARMAFDVAARSYTGYLDANRDGVLGQTAAETAALGVFRTRTLDAGVKIGRNVQPDLPGYAGAGATTLPSTRIDFDSRGLTTPLGTKGVVYIVSTTDTTAAAAVSISGAGAIQAWAYTGGVWK
jgi:prepilin-type N-terminal cleavage/methylation domain-containing protein